MTSSKAFQRATTSGPDLSGYATTSALAAKADATALAKGKVDAFTTAGAQAWTCPAGVTRAKVTVIGGGGAGSASGTNGTGGGGGAGGCAIKFFNNLVPGTAYNLTVGAAAAASSFVGPGGVTPTGNGGSAGASASNIGASGAGGTATGGDINLTGQAGCTGWFGSTSGVIGGTGGGSILGGGGRGLSVNSGNVAGGAAGAPGAGGGGAVSNSGTSSAGGTGAPGAVIIEY